MQGLVNHGSAVCSVFHAGISNPMPPIMLEFKSHMWSVMNLQSAVYVMSGFQIPCLQSSLIWNPRPGQPWIGSLQCISSLDFKSHDSDHPRFSIQDMGHHGLAVCGVFHAWISDPMPQIILNFKSGAWLITDWQSAVYVMPGCQIPCLRSSSIVNPRPGKSQIGSLQCISRLDFKCHASDHPQC